MGGGLMELVAYGAQDIYLTGNPQITFFKLVYRRHTNFSMESIKQDFSGISSGTMAEIKGKKTSCTISRNGDLITKMYLEMKHTIDAPDDFSSSNSQGGGDEGHVNTSALLIDKIELEIGGQLIDRQSGNFMEVWSELTELNDSCVRGGTREDDKTQIGTKFQNMACMGGVVSLKGTMTAHVPLYFWFCRNPGLALPLIALQYHEVKLHLTYTSSIIRGYTSLINNLYVDYIYLDTDERRRFAQVSHEYLIEQVQYIHSSSGKIHKLNMNHPVKEIIWTIPYAVTTGIRGWSGSGGGGFVTNTTFKLQFNGIDRFSERHYSYFTEQQVYDHHTGAPVTSNDSARYVFPGNEWARIHENATTTPYTDSDNEGRGSNDEIAVYSFALYPEEHQPSGTCNFSRIDTATLISSINHELHIYAINYNVLRIMSGMGGLAYSN